MVVANRVCVLLSSENLFESTFKYTPEIDCDDEDVVVGRVKYRFCPQVEYCMVVRPGGYIVDVFKAFSETGKKKSSRVEVNIGFKLVVNADVVKKYTGIDVGEVYNDDKSFVIFDCVNENSMFKMFGDACVFDDDDDNDSDELSLSSSLSSLSTPPPSVLVAPPQPPQLKNKLTGVVDGIVMVLKLFYNVAVFSHLIYLMQYAPNCAMHLYNHYENEFPSFNQSSHNSMLITDL